jgi:hypothetical protein
MTDNAESAAFDERAPPAERFDAQSELQKAHMPTTASDLLPPEPIMRVIEAIRAQQEEDDLRKSAGGAQIIPFPGAANRRRDRDRGMRSVYLDDLQINVLGDYYEKPGVIQFEAMRKMVEQTPVLAGLVLTRARQVSMFCKPRERDEGPGFEIAHIDRNHKLGREEQESIRLLTRFFLNCGWEFNPRRRRALRRDNFTQFVMKLVRDSLTMDSAPIETEMKRDRSLGIDGFYAVDGSTVRLCTETGYEGDDSVYALQVVQGRIMTAYTLDDLIYEPRNPRTEVTMAGYGLSETELLVRTVTGFLNAMTLNIKGFSENAIPRGILHLVGDFKQADLDAFKRYWNSMVRGVNNAWALPVLATKESGDKASFERIDAGFDEMYFSKWMTFLTSIICAIYGMDPEEINFESFSAQRSSLSGSDTAEKLASSRDKGLKPLVSYVQSLMSDFIASDFSDKYVFRFTGLEDEDREKKHEMRKLTMKLDEGRALIGLEPVGGDIGDAPLNPTLSGLYMQQKQAEQADFGDPAGGGDFGSDPDDPDDERGDGEGDGEGGGAGAREQRETDDAPDAGEDEERGRAMRKASPPVTRPGWWP